MVNAPSFAHTTGTLNTFSHRTHNDPRMVLWHVDRYARNYKTGCYFNVAAFPHALNNSFPIHVLRHTEPEGWPVREFMEEAWKQADIDREFFGFVFNDSYKLSGFWCSFLYDGESETLNRYGQKQQTICPNLSLTRFDWRPNSAPKYYSFGDVKQANRHFVYNDAIPDIFRLWRIFGVDEVSFKCGTFEPHVLTTKYCGTRFHGPSWEIKNPRLVKTGGHQ